MREPEGNIPVWAILVMVALGIVAAATLAFVTPAAARKHPANYLVPAGMHPAYKAVQYKPERKVMHHSHGHAARRHSSTARHIAKPHRSDPGGAFGFRDGKPDWCSAHERLKSKDDWYRCRGKTKLPADTAAPKQPQAPVELSSDPYRDSALKIGALVGMPEGFADGMATPLHPQESYARRPRKLTGKLAVGDDEFPFVSGGSGWSIPWGHWRVTPEAVGRWGARHGAIGLNGDEIPDKQIGRDRDGVEIHAASGAHTSGCVGIREHYAQLKAAVLGMIDKFGAAWLHITPSGASITPWKVAVVVQGEVHGEGGDGDGDHASHHHQHRRKLARGHHHRQHFAGN